MARVPFKICVTRLVGTSIFRASSAALISSACSSSARCSPGWIAVSAIAMLLVMVNNLHVCEVYGPDYKSQTELAAKIKKIFQETPGVVDVDWYVEDPQNKYDMKVDLDKAA